MLKATRRSAAKPDQLVVILRKAARLASDPVVKTWLRNLANRGQSASGTTGQRPHREDA